MTAPTRISNQSSKWKYLFSREINSWGINDILSRKTSSAPLSEQMIWLQHLIQWLFQEQVETRFKFLFQSLDRNPDWKRNATETIYSILINGRFLKFYTDIGISVEYGFWTDVFRRIVRKVIPPGGIGDLQDLLAESFESEESRLALSQVSLETLHQARNSLFPLPDNPIWNKLHKQANDGLLFLSTNTAHFGMSTIIRRRSSFSDNISHSPFFRLSNVIKSQYERDLEIREAELEIGKIYEHLEENGVSVDIVNRLEILSALLKHIKSLSDLVTQPDLLKVRNFVIQAVESSQFGRSVTEHVQRSFYLLAREIVERNGHSGEHYIARDRKELTSIFLSSVGGGIIVVAMTILKILFLSTFPAPFFYALGIWIIYSGGFIAMQLSGATLATKIPSFTASRLAGYLKFHHVDVQGFKSVVSQTLKSQSIALTGNLVGVIPVVMILNLGVIEILSRGILTDTYARHLIDDMNPFWSFIIPLGALTGFQLWLSSIFGGWFENWIVFNRIPEAITNHYRLKEIFGESRLKRASMWLLDQSSSLATNIALGFLFGFVPLFGLLFGLNWNGHHVTISTASAFFAMSELHFQISTQDVLMTMLSLILIGFMNFVISFSMALIVAASARKLKMRRVLYYLLSTFEKGKVK